MNLREKGRDLIYPSDKSPYTHKKFQKATWQRKNATKNFDDTTIWTDLGWSVEVTTATLLVLWISKRDFYQDVYTILNRIKFDMDHMRISGTEPSSVILSQTK